jgi:uncharacterized protein (TIGR02996 family)
MRVAQEESMLATIGENLDDDTPRLVYSDWLEERGGGAQAVLIRDLCRLRSGHNVEPYPVDQEVLRLVIGSFLPRGRKSINQLSRFEESLMHWFRISWIATGLKIGPCDRTYCEMAVDFVYQAAGLDKPKAKVWVDGPVHGAIAAHMMNQVWGQVRGQVWGQVRGQVGGQVRDQVRDQVWDQVWDQVRGQVGGQVGGQVWGQVRGQVWDQVRGQVRYQVNRCGYGHQDAGWLSFYSFFSAIGLSSCDRIFGLFNMSQCGWWWPFEGAVILTEMPIALEMEAGKLRYIRYADGLEVKKT